MSDNDRDTIECDHCGTTMWDDEQGRREMELHEGECGGIDDPKARFGIGDRVQFSSFGRERLNVDSRKGEVVGFGSEKHNHGHCVRVRWDDRKTPERYAHSFIVSGAGGDP